MRIVWLDVAMVINSNLISTSKRLACERRRISGCRFSLKYVCVRRVVKDRPGKPSIILSRLLKSVLSNRGYFCSTELELNPSLNCFGWTFRKRKKLSLTHFVKFNWWFACDVMAAMLVDRNNKIFLLGELSAIFMQTMWTNFLLFCPPTWRQWKPPI